MISVRDLIALLFLIYMLSSSIVRKKPNFTALVIFGFLLGFLRRFLPSDSLLSISGFGLDPLLLVIPICFLLFLALSEIAETRENLLNFSLKLLIFISTIGIFNPRQGSLLVGLTGWVAYVIPILFVYLGTKIPVSDFTRILNTLKISGACVCVYGFFQVIFGYNSWDQRWFDSVTLSGDYSVVGYGTNRPFSTFSSIGEYSQAIGISAGILAYQYVVEQIKLREFIFFNLIFVVSAALTASRSALLICSLIAFSPIFFKPRLNTISKMIFPKLIAGAFAASWLIPVIFNLIPVRLLGNAASLLDRQAAGLSGNDSGVTSASVHLFQTNEALVESFKSVIGFGTGAISGAQKFNGITRMNAETDIGNASFAFGIAGFVIMLLIFFGLFAAFSHSVLRQGILLILLLLPSVNNWFNPGHYSTVWVVWLLIGFILRQKHLVTYG